MYTVARHRLKSTSEGGSRNTVSNELRNTPALLLREVAKDVSIEPPLHPLTEEHLHLCSAILDDGTRLDIAASGVWSNQFEHTFDIQVFNPHAVSNSTQSLSSTYHCHEQEKHCSYEERVQEVEQASFVPLVFSATS